MKLVSAETKIRIDLSKCQYEILEEVVSELKWENDDFEKPDIIWQDSALNPMALTLLSPYQRINHFPGMYAISRKDYLARHLKAMEQLHKSEFEFFPETWVLPHEHTSLKTHMASNTNAYYICKPPNLSQGKGIFLTKWISDIPENCVVQKYLENPYLLDGFKFDLRLYVLVTGFDPLRVYIHEQGIVRLATIPYVRPTDTNIHNTYMHLTNYAINKNNPNFVHNKNYSEDFVGHKRSFKSFLKALEEDGHNVKKIMARIDDIVLKTLCTVQPFIVNLYKTSQPNDTCSAVCFQILGFDILLDHKLRPSLLEVNHTPSFTTDSPLDRKVKKAVIKDCLKMVAARPDCQKKFLREHTDYLIDRSFHSFYRVRLVKSERREKFLEHQIEMESTFHGGYRKIYPLNNIEKYQKYMRDAEGVYSSKARRRNKESEISCIPRLRKSSADKKFVINDNKSHNRRRSCVTRISLVPKVVQIKINNDFAGGVKA
jgi:tubulin polyglutamylase TTLL6/13